MTEEDQSSTPQPKSIETLTPREVEEYSAIPGWRVWNSPHIATRQYSAFLDELATKPHVLKVSAGEKGYSAVRSRAEQGKRRLPFSVNSLDANWTYMYYLLEPLGQADAVVLEREGKLTDPNGRVFPKDNILTQQEFKQIVQPPGK